MRALHESEIAALRDSELQLGRRAREDAVREALEQAKAEHEAALTFAREQFEEQKRVAIQAASESNDGASQQVADAHRHECRSCVS